MKLKIVFDKNIFLTKTNKLSSTDLIIELLKNTSCNKKLHDVFLSESNQKVIYNYIKIIQNCNFDDSFKFTRINYFLKLLIPYVDSEYYLVSCIIFYKKMLNTFYKKGKLNTNLYYILFIDLFKRVFNYDDKIINIYHLVLHYVRDLKIGRREYYFKFGYMKYNKPFTKEENTNILKSIINDLGYIYNFGFRLGIFDIKFNNEDKNKCLLSNTFNMMRLNYYYKFKKIYRIDTYIIGPSNMSFSLSENIESCYLYGNKKLLKSFLKNCKEFDIIEKMFTTQEINISFHNLNFLKYKIIRDYYSETFLSEQLFKTFDENYSYYVFPFLEKYNNALHDYSVKNYSLVNSNLELESFEMTIFLIYHLCNKKYKNRLTKILKEKIRERYINTIFTDDELNFEQNCKYYFLKKHYLKYEDYIKIYDILMQ